MKWIKDEWGLPVEPVIIIAVVTAAFVCLLLLAMVVDALIDVFTIMSQ